MDDPQPDPADGFLDGGILDRSQQAARFLDLARQHGLGDDDDGDGTGFGSGTDFGSDED